MRLLLVVLSLGCSGDLVRDDYRSEVTACLGGINEQVDDATKDQCADARNIWVKDGDVQQRPGYIGLAFLRGQETTVTVFYARAEDVSAGTFTSPAGTGVLTLSGLVALTTGVEADRWYIGLGSTFNDIALAVAGPNSNATRYVAEYWNGSAWVWLNINEHVAGTDPYLDGNHLGATGSQTLFNFAAPQDWATTTVDSQSAYWIRFSLRDADFDAAVTVDVDNGGTLVSAGSDIRGAAVLRFPSVRRTLYLVAEVSTNPFIGLAYFNADSPTFRRYIYDTMTPYRSDEPATVAVIPEFDEAYMAYANIVTVHKAYPAAADSIRTAVEARPEIVGPNAKYSTSYIAQLGEFPRAKYISYFKGFLWAAGIDGDKHGIRWSAPGFAYKVWPAISRETLAENDNSEVKAIYGFGENMLVWKNDSMWQMVFRGTNAFGLAEFSPVRVPGAVGCVSQSSVVEIHGKVYWLAEDGVYSFDGTAVKPVHKERIQSIFRRINPSRRAFAVATDWAPHNVYLLSVALDGSSANNTVLVYDYNRKAWWIWDSIEAQFWLNDEDSADNAVLYFGDSSGRIYELGKGLTDHGGTVTSYVTGRRMAMTPVGATKRVRGVSVIANNLAQALDVEVIPDGAASGDSNDAVDYTDFDEVEYGSAVASSVYSTDRQRTRYCGFRTDCRYFHTKVTHSTKNTPFKLFAMQAYYEPLGKRR